MSRRLSASIASAHVRLACAVPGALRVETAQLFGGPSNQPMFERASESEVVVRPLQSIGLPEPLHYRMTEVWFADEQARLAAVHATEGVAFARHLLDFATGGADIMLLDVHAHDVAGT